MRLLIKRPSLSLAVPFQFEMSSTTINVYRETLTELKWTWGDRDEIRLQTPQRRFGKHQVWRVVCQEQVFIGELDETPARESLLNRRKWQCGPLVFYQDSRFCSGSVRAADKRRLVYWRSRYSMTTAFVDVVCSNHVANSTVPVLLAFVLAEFLNLD